ncbi:TetR/AcrR family transcriptional regulator [Nocardia bhagyanarayanae]|uniref:TetR family transcriptional regulator n=1 Tax=Nocardia bhagyanarayanae TaxID=1215925 RepID=A0A543FEX4_9NOCA|nr:TetR/AcrR family transcriptional regulator [Nocardia bhagyanarayanae]TQM32304.1 TetR family transcriptional regulator [Nocardia bhagyanarayanae]
MTQAKAGRGRIDKREAILDAAFTVFARRGYNQACVQEIADEADVAKPTVYNHLTDKETLFREAVEAAADAVGAQCLDAIERLRDPGADLPAALTDSARRLLRVCASEHARALRSLTYAQLAAFPDLVDSVQSRTSRRVAEALGDRFARLMLAGRLRTTDPAGAAEQFLALLTGPLESRSRLGARKVPAAELRALADSAVDTFVRAYATPVGAPDLT